MNRIILIGNGFDLAHGLETSYEQFINSFWKKIIEDFNNRHICIFDNDFVAIDADVRYSDNENLNSFYTFKERLKISKGQIKFKNYFLEVISKNLLLRNWVDIEEEYYKLLLGTGNDKIPYNEYKRYSNVYELNKDFLSVKKALETYLMEITKNGVGLNEAIAKNIYSEFDLKDFTKEGVKQMTNYFVNKAFELFEKKEKLDVRSLEYKTELLLGQKDLDKPFLEKLFLDDINRNSYFNLFPDNLLFLSFNYTDTEKVYVEYNNYLPSALYSHRLEAIKSENKNIIHIHGELNNSKNPIIFGYGDEIGKEYSEIENLNKNEYLENVKSIRYSDTENYKQLLNFINPDKYQVFLFGHSCGLSDRTLLNTLFEHENCVSIKLFYHKKEDGTDDYSNAIRNISRHFKDKAMMREKVVNKEYCQPLT